MVDSKLVRHIVLIFTSLLGLTVILMPQKTGCYPLTRIQTNPKYNEISINQLSKTISQTNSQGGSVVLKDVYSNKILTNTSVVTNPNKDVCGNELDLSSMSWEPGSIMKPLTIQSAMDIYGLKLDDTVEVESAEKYGENIILNHRMFGSGSYKVKDISKQSINTGVAKIYQSLGQEIFVRQKNWNYRLTNTYRLGESTGYDIKYEDIGYVPDYSWVRDTDYRYALSSIGIGIHATPIQMVNAYATALSGNSKDISEQSTKRLKELLKYNIQDSIHIKSPTGYKVAIGGKTGTSSMIDKYLSYSNQDIGSFIGFIEMDQKLYIMIVQLVSPNSEHASGDAMNTWKNIVQQLVDEQLLIQTSTAT